MLHIASPVAVKTGLLKDLANLHSHLVTFLHEDRTANLVPSEEGSPSPPGDDVLDPTTSRADMPPNCLVDCSLAVLLSQQERIRILEQNGPEPLRSAFVRTRPSRATEHHRVRVTHKGQIRNPHNFTLSDTDLFDIHFFFTCTNRLRSNEFSSRLGMPAPLPSSLRRLTPQEFFPSRSLPSVFPSTCWFFFVLKHFRHHRAETPNELMPDVWGYLLRLSSGFAFQLSIFLLMRID